MSGSWRELPDGSVICIGSDGVRTETYPGPFMCAAQRKAILDFFASEPVQAPIEQ